MSVLFARWKGAKITTEHATHVLCAYRMSLASLRPNQVSCLTIGNCFDMYLLYLQFAFTFFFSEFNIVVMYCSLLLHIFSNYIVNMIVCICWIIVDCSTWLFNIVAMYCSHLLHICYIFFILLIWCIQKVISIAIWRY